MPDSNLTPAERARAADDISGYRPRWSSPTSELSFLSVLRARANNDAHHLSVVSLQLAVRDARIDEGGSVAIVPGPITGSLPPGVEVTRLTATWNHDGLVGRGQVYVLVGVTLEQSKRLRSRRAGLEWLLFSGPESESRVWLVRGEQRDDLGEFQIKVVLAGLAMALQVESVDVERRPETFTDALMASRFKPTSPPPLQTVP